MLLSALLAMAPVSVNVDAQIVATSMFKNGYAMVLRDIPIDRSGEYRLNSIPAASLGTLWFAGSDGVTIDAVRTVNDIQTTMSDVGTMADIINANVGKDVRIGLRDGDKLSGETVSGKLLSSAGEVLVVKTASSTIALPKTRVSSIESVSGELLYKIPSISTRRTLAFTVKGKGHVSMVSLEKGISWAPGYSIDVSSKDKLSLVAKATVLNDDEDLKDVTAKFVTGFPNVPFAAFQDPLTSNETLDQFLGLMESSIAPINGPAGGFRSLKTTNSRVSFANQAMAPAPMEAGAGMPVSTVPGEQLEDLFFYNQPNVTLEKGQRSYYVLFRMEAPYKKIYTCELPDPVQNNVEFRAPTPDDDVPDVWHTLSFKNTSGKPLTTGPAITFKSGEILGQDTMNYVSAGADAELKVTKALDVRVLVNEEEVSRERAALKNVYNNPIFDLVTLKGTVQLTNTKAEAVTLRVRHDYTGELITADGDPVNKKTNKGLRDANSSGRLTWNKTLTAGQSMTLTYTYKVYVRSQ